MNPAASTTKRLKVIHPAGANAKMLAGASLLLALISAAQFLLQETPDPVLAAFDLSMIVAGLGGIIYAIRHMGSVTIPEQLSSLAGEENVKRALRSRSVAGKDTSVFEKSYGRFLLMLVPDERLSAMSGRLQRIVVQASAAGSKAVFILVGLSFALLFDVSELVVPLMIITGTFALFHVALLLALRSGSTEQTSVHAATEMISSAGHPQMLFALLENKARSIDKDGYAVFVRSQQPVLEVKGVEGTGTVHGSILVEEQPRPLTEASANQFSRIAFPLSCLGLLAGVWMIRSALATGPDQASVLYYITTFAVLYLSKRAMQLTWNLDAAFEFESRVCLLDIDGTFSQSRVRVGKGIDDSIESENVAVRADLRVSYFGALALTEADSVRSPRFLVSLRATPEVHARIASFQQETQMFRTSKVAPLAVDIGGTHSGDIIRGNLGVRAAAAGFGGEMLGAGPAEPALIPEGNGESKTCPDCAESVKAAARKCRFCGHMFA